MLAKKRAARSLKNYASFELPKSGLPCERF